MLSLTIISSSNPLSTPFLHRHFFSASTASTSTSTSRKFSPKYTSISAIIIPPSSSSSSSYSKSKSTQQKQLYQPYRPPPSPLPSKYRNLDTNGRLEILTNRLGLWFEYAPLIPSLIDEGFSSPLIEELTGISGIEQNRLVVAAQVRDSLVESQPDSDLISFFDSGGSELLYEIRLLSTSQRAVAAKYAVDNQFDGRQTQDLAKAIKDKPRRKGDKGWENFDDELPGDCLGFMYYRQALEHKTASSVDAWKAALEKALEAVESEIARKTVLEELEGKGEEENEKVGVLDDGVRVPVVRMQLGEVAESTFVVVFPVCKAEEGKDGEVEEAPWEVVREGEFGVVEAEKGWSRWVVLPGWQPLAGLKRGGVAIEFKNSRFLPGKTHRWNTEEPILVVADRGQREVEADNGFYLVVGGGNGSGEEGLKVVRGLVLKEMGVNETLGTVVLVVRPPREDNDEQLKDEDWD